MATLWEQMHFFSPIQHYNGYKYILEAINVTGAVPDDVPQQILSWVLYRH